jgi:hypothetical protein
VALWVQHVPQHLTRLGPLTINRLPRAASCSHSQVSDLLLLLLLLLLRLGGSQEGETLGAWGGRRGGLGDIRLCIVALH